MDRGACRKSSPLAIFSAKTGFHCTFGAAVKTCKETLLRKASDLSAHVAEVGLAVGGLRPSDTSHGVYRQSAGVPIIFLFDMEYKSHAALRAR